jgi:hypothetical protein
VFNQIEIDAQKAKFGELREVNDGADSPRWAVVIRCPSRGDYKRFRLTAERDRLSAIETMVSACIVLPDAATANSLFDRFPAAIDVIAGELIDFAGGTGTPGKKAV